ncbi:uncharacterized protein V1518DRAFT_417578 [Limtongia smithiae]|uniref:uncharacterized protein n=1 Tax=Limtongia smithiae TaxID=1125753 RepID=UPI0034CEB5E5
MVWRDRRLLSLRVVVLAFATAVLVGLVVALFALDINVSSIQSVDLKATICGVHDASQEKVDSYPGATTATTAELIEPTSFASHYLQGADDVFLMIKTGATVLWQRMPIQLVTTLPQVPNFALYSDAEDKISGIPVIDILANTSRELRMSDNFVTYREQRQVIDRHLNLEIYDPRLNIDGGWSLDKFKNLPMVANAYRTMPTARWYIFMDADTYILWPNMLSWLNTLKSYDELYMGSVAYVGDQPFAHGGSGVIMSAALVKRVFGKNPDLEWKYEEFTRNQCCGDYVLAYVLNEFNVRVVSGELYPHVSWRIQGEPPTSVYYNKDNWCSEIVTFHHLTAHDIQKLYEFEHKFGPDERILYKDVYHHFVLPYLVEDRVDNWDNLSESRRYRYVENEVSESDSVDPASGSFEACERKCDEWDRCLQFRYRIGECHLSEDIRLGMRVVNDDSPFSSKWRVDRIRNMRKNSQCDSLKGPKEGFFFETNNKI